MNKYTCPMHPQVLKRRTGQMPALRYDIGASWQYNSFS